jgi:Protein of unknown function (DUF1592)/Protein of unknown function (DUF1595)/Protein of unknown function (DUF1588)/Protein of unknown function (DUF1585)/Protein of unknown function (DUF1587)
MKRNGSWALALVLMALACGRASKGSSMQPGNTGAVGGDDSTPSHGAGEGGSAGQAATSGLSSVDLEGSPIYTRVQRLTNKQWEHAVTDILHFAKPQGLAQNFAPPPPGGVEFDNNEKVLFVDPSNILDFESGAEAAAALATGTPEALSAVYSGTDATGFVSTLGRRAFRRPLTADERARYGAIFARGEELYGSGFANGASLVIRAMLQSPSFLYRTELGEKETALTDFELASKLSFWLLGTTPSDALLDAAEAGKLQSVDALEAEARQMLEDPRAVEVMRDFHSQLLGLARFDELAKLGAPEFTPALGLELRLVSEAFFDSVFVQGFGLYEVLTSKRAYVGPELSPLYGLTPNGSGITLQTLGPERSGYFMQVPFLAVSSPNQQSNPLRRGNELQRALLCKTLVDPGPPVPPMAPLPGETTRERFTRLTQQGCGNCHRTYVDPLGFALENFDGTGRERNIDNGRPVDTAASYPFAEGVASFANGNELMNIMSKSTQVHTCYAKHLTSYALGRDLVEADRALLEALAGVSRQQSLKELAVALVRHPSFRTRQGVTP